jgi:hypothetical protein
MADGITWGMVIGSDGGEFAFTHAGRVACVPFSDAYLTAING